jgi:hypothetical protein
MPVLASCRHLVNKFHADQRRSQRRGTFPLPPKPSPVHTRFPYVQVYGSGLTGEVYRLRIAGKEYNLKKRRAVAGVANLNGQLSFLNEVQRRQALQRLKDDPVTAPRFTHIVPTLYADYRLGILLSRGSMASRFTS